MIHYLLRVVVVPFLTGLEISHRNTGASKQENGRVRSGGDIIRQWLLTNTSITIDNYLSNAEIREYIKDSEPNLMEKYTDKQLSQKIGEELKYIYGDKLLKHKSMGIIKYNVDIE